MSEHTIDENLIRLQNATTAIGNAITTKGGTVSQGDGLEEFAADIATIPSGGGGVAGVYKLSYSNANITNNQMFITKVPYTYSSKQYYTTMVFGMFYLASEVSTVNFYYPKAFEDDNVSPLFGSTSYTGLYYANNQYLKLNEPTIDLSARKITLSFATARNGGYYLLAKWN